MSDSLITTTQVKKLNFASHLIRPPFYPSLSQHPPNPKCNHLPDIYDNYFLGYH